MNWQVYSRVATIAVAASGFPATGIYPFEPNIFTDDDFRAADTFLERPNMPLHTVKMTKKLHLLILQSILILMKKKLTETTELK